jgi:hypothetical protein
MEQNINLMIEDFKDNLVNTINNAGFPPSIVYYILKDVYSNVESSYFSYIHQQKRQVAENQLQQLGQVQQEQTELNSADAAASEDKED